MSSSRSIAAARNRRAPESGLQARMPTKQPITSIQSQRAFVQPPPPLTNNTSNNKLPFSKLTISDAVGLITLRLGKVEQYLIELQNSDNNTSNNSNNSGGVDNSIITTIVNRLDALEKKEINNNNQDIIKHVSTEIDAIKQSMRQYDINVKLMNTTFNNKLSDIDIAFVELEKCIDSSVADKLNNAHHDDPVDAIKANVDNELPENIAFTVTDESIEDEEEDPVIELSV